MPGIENKPPTSEQIETIRKKFQDHISKSGKDYFDEVDINRVMNEEEYVKRWFMHKYDAKGDQLETCIQCMIAALKWRKKEKVNDLTSAMLNPEAKQKGNIYMRNKDKDGWPLLVFAVRKHIKGMESPEIMKQHFLYYMDRIDR